MRWVVLVLFSAALTLTGCGGDDDTAASAAGGTTGGAGGGGNAITLRVDPPEVSLVVELGVTPPSQDYKAYAKHADAPDDPEEDVTLEAAWSAGPSVASIDEGGHLALVGIG